jgi:hypothetical protein
MTRCTSFTLAMSYMGRGNMYKKKKKTTKMQDDSLSIKFTLLVPEHVAKTPRSTLQQGTRL